jgi:broad specificity phosphatase PhoE
MKVYLVRHGETLANVKEDESPNLTEKGVKQGKTVAEHFKKEEVDAIYSSDLKRALENAKEIKKYHKVKLVVDSDFKEIYRLIVGGPPKSTRKNRYEEDKERAEKVWFKLLKWKYEKVIVVCHGNLIRYLISKALKKNPKDLWSQNINNASITTLEIHNKNAKILSLNSTSHINET